MIEAIPRAHGAEPDKDGHVEQQIDAWLQTIILCLDSEPVVPSKDVSSSETGENIIAANQAVRADDEKLFTGQWKLSQS